jgi:hypothetical protein
MRTTTLAAALSIALLALPTGALAKCVDLRLSAAPGGRTDVKAFVPGGGVIEGVRPRVVIEQGSARKTFAARPTSRSGIYRADVVFPATGRWHFAVNDGFDRLEHGAGLVHRFADVAVAPGQTHMRALPRPRSGSCEDQLMREAPKPAARVHTGKPAGREADGGGVSSMSFAAAGLLLVLALAALGVRRRARTQP